MTSIERHHGGLRGGQRGENEGKDLLYASCLDILTKEKGVIAFGEEWRIKN